MKTFDIGKAGKPLRPLHFYNTFFAGTSLLFAAYLGGDIITGEFASTIIILACFAPVTWLAWRTGDPVRTVLYKPASAIYWYTVVFGLGYIALVLLAAFHELTDGSILGTFYAIMYSILALLGALSLRKLKKTEIAPLGVTLAGLGGAPAGRHAPGRITMSMRVNATRGFLLLGLAAVMFISISLLFRSASDHLNTSDTLTFWDEIVRRWHKYDRNYNLTPIVLYIVLRARADFRVKAENLLSLDRRPATLFLRSFSDDEKSKITRVLFIGRPGLESLDFSLEGRLAEHFSTSGPFIAVGSPNGETPHVGAARAYFSEQAWQSRVCEWMDSSRLIVVLAGITNWVAWEIDQAVRRGHADKLIVAFPEKRHLKPWRLAWRPPFMVRANTAAARLEAVRMAFRATRWEKDMQGLDDPINIRSLTFAESGEVTVVRGRSASRNECQLAILVSEYVLSAEHRLAKSKALVDILGSEELQN